MEDLTREDINRLIEENAILRAQVRALTGGKGGTNRPRTPQAVTDKYGIVYFDCDEYLSRLIRTFLFPGTKTKESHLALVRGESRIEPKKFIKERVISIKEMTDEQYELYCKAFTKIVDILYELKGDKRNG